MLDSKFWPVLRSPSMTIECRYEKLIKVGVAVQKLARVDGREASMVEQVRIGRFVRAVMVELGPCEELRNKIVNSYGVPRQDNPNIFDLTKDPKRRAEYDAEMKKWAEVVVPIQASPLPPDLHALANLDVGDQIALLEAGLIVLPDVPEEDAPPAKKPTPTS